MNFAAILRGFFAVLVVMSCFASEGVTATRDSEKPERLALFVSGHSSGFWPMVEAFALATAEDLDIMLDIHRYGSSHVNMIEVIRGVLSDPAKRPDGILFHNFNGRGGDALALAEQFKVPALMFNAGPGAEDSFGAPQEKLKYFIGQITPDDVRAGYDLAVTLYNEAARLGLRDENGVMQMLVFEGTRASIAAQERLMGLQKFLSEHDDVAVEQYFRPNWRRDRAAAAFKVGMERYPKARVAWAASDSMALGVLDAAKDAGKKPGVDFITGGVDLLPGIQPLVQDGKLAVSIGAHYTEVVWAVILLYDYLHGCDFSKAAGATVHKSTMMVQSSGASPVLPGESREEVAEWAKTVDFSQWSQCANPQWRGYPFTPSVLFNAKE